VAHRRHRAGTHGRDPVGSGGGRDELARDDIRDAVEDAVLVGDVVVERHRFDPQPLADSEHREGLDPP
jgi:hypothetical protein